ncbi:trypco2 family protein [Stutzerimonas nitrititolerans]|uniref:trypco2 family protein n=1 Tax=Stutzerimonas nitrititolerans TaxID=2482751 RepID=UPI0028AD17BB|nr:trypco2 family protein [Stutzerimonas nitrititolerans]
MKGKISIKDSIKSVKAEILESIDDENPLFELTNVELEVAFQLEANAGAGFNLYVFDASAETTATQTHKVMISLTPFIEKKKIAKDTNIGRAITETRAQHKGSAIIVAKPKPSSKSSPLMVKKDAGKITAKKETAKRK